MTIIAFKVEELLQRFSPDKDGLVDYRSFLRFVTAHQLVISAENTIREFMRRAAERGTDASVLIARIDKSNRGIWTGAEFQVLITGFLIMISSSMSNSH